MLYKFGNAIIKHSFHFVDFFLISYISSNVLKTGPVIEPEKLPVHGSLVGPTVEPRLNR